MSETLKPALAQKKIDEAFEKAEDWTKPYLKKIRAFIHQADGEIVEDWKWGACFTKSGIVCGLWPFKKHISLLFFKGSMMKDPDKVLLHGGKNLLNRMMKFTPEDNLDEALIIRYVQEAVAVNESGMAPPVANKNLVVPKELTTYFKQDPDAEQFFTSLAYTHRKEFIVWIEEAKKPETRQRRVEKTIEMLSKKIKKR